MTVDHSEWAAPIVAVPKKDGNVRVCGDYKVTINPDLEVDQYPLPKPENMFATLAGGTKFSTLITRLQLVGIGGGVSETRDD